MRCASKGGYWVALVPIACAGSPPNPAPTPRAPPAAQKPVAAEPSATPEDDWSREEDFEDRDGDKIADHRDRCPDEPERYNGFEDQDGCPDKGHVGNPGEERIFIVFDALQAERDPKEIRIVVDEILQLLAANQSITLLEVGGHADASEEKGPRKQLSKRRAEFVKRVLIGAGVDKARLVSRGFGSDCPLLTDAVPEGDRRLNRRITFRILKTTSGPRELNPCPNDYAY